MADPADALHDALGAPPPKGVVRALDAAELERLAGLIAARAEAQRRELAAATDAGFKHIPFPLRGAVRKMLGG